MTQQESDWDKYQTFMDDMRKQMEILHVKFDFLINRISHLENTLAETQCNCEGKEKYVKVTPNYTRGTK